MRGFYTMNEEISVLGDDKTWNDEKESDWNGRCEDVSEEDDDEEDEEREWCD